MKNDCEVRKIIAGLALIIAGAIIIPVIIRKITGKVYRISSKATEEDFVNNGPVTVRKTEDETNDDRY